MVESFDSAAVFVSACFSEITCSFISSIGLGF